ncbi:MAG: aldo/keto reductase [Sphingomonas sp.]
MELRNLGVSGPRVSAIGLGTNNFGMRDDVDAPAVVGAALDLGINFFDSAEAYGKGKSEEVLGRALGARRHEAIIATKWGGTINVPPGTGARDYVLNACETSLRRLGTDYIDLYQFHAPDPSIPIEETLLACGDLVRQGKVRHLGLSNFPAWRIAQAQETARRLGLAPLVSTQEHYSLLRRDIVEGERLDAIREYELGLLPFFPLASGLLSGKYRRGEDFPEGSRFAVLRQLGTSFTTDRNWRLAERLTEFAEARGHAILELAFAWLLARPAVASVIAGATRVEQVRANAAAAGWALSAEDLAGIDAITAGE